MTLQETTAGAIEEQFSSKQYALLESIGEGGFGKVFKAVQLNTQRFVAIKFLRLTNSECPHKRQEKIARFNRECDLVRRLNHPNIVSLLDKGQQGDYILYAVYEFVDGITLKDYIASNGQISPTESAEIMASVLDALAHAHTLGIIHRDIKPANIMLFNVGAKQHVKILDFGISTLKSDSKTSDLQTLTLNDETLGTPKYSAPEQLRGEPSLPQTDVYSWGLVFLECLTGTSVIKGNSAASVFFHQLSAANIPLGPLAGHYSAHFFRRVLNKKALDRPGNTVELYHEFRRFNFSDIVLQAPCSFSTEGSSSAQESMTQTIELSSSYYSEFTERKQITALCLILSEDRTYSSNELTLERQDIAEMLLSDQQSQSVDIALRYGATHVASVGDTALFYFGYPNVSDNDSRLSARAALDIWNNLHTKQTSLLEQHNLKFDLRIGLSKGMMRSIDGAAPEGRVAAEAMTLARNSHSGGIICSPQFKDMLSNQLLFECVVNDSIHVAPYGYRLKGERLSEAFSFLRKTQSHNSIVGRQTILEQLYRLNQPNCQYQLFHVYGDAGIGKSRLILELKERLSNTSSFSLQCLPEFHTNALYPLLNFFSTYFDLKGQDAEDNYKKAICSLSLSTLERERGSAILWAWLQPYSRLSNQNEKKFQQAISNLTLNQQKSYLFLTMSRLLSLICNSSESSYDSYLFICEDIHWSDATTLEFIGYLIKEKLPTTLGFYWLNSSRTPIPKTLKSSKALEIGLSSLSQNESHQLIEHLFDNVTVSEQVKKLFTTRSDGNPLFLEELVFHAQKNNLVKKINGCIDFTVKEPELQVPENLRGTLQQKLNDLTFAKDTAQLAATIGRTFSEALILHASDKNIGQIQADLDELQRNNIVFKQRSVEGNLYQFKHALIRDAIYESSTTQHISHQQLALAMEEQEGYEYPPAIIGDHWSKTNTPIRATTYYLTAGDQAAKASMVEDAIRHFEKSLNISLDAIKNDETNPDKLSALIGLGDNLIRLARHDEARSHYLDALNEIKEDDILTSVSLHVKYGKSLETHHLHEKALKSYDQAETLINSHIVKDSRWYNTWLTVQLAKLYIHYWRNELSSMSTIISNVETCLEHFTDPISSAQFYDAKLQFELRRTRYDLSLKQINLAQTAHSISLETDDHQLQTHSLFSLGFTYLFSQQYTEAEKHLLAALKNANDKADATLKTRCLAYLTVLFRLKGDIENTRNYVEQAFSYAKNSGMDDYVAIACANESWLAFRQGDISHSQALVQKSNNIWRALSDEFPFPLQWLALLVELELIMLKQSNSTAGSDQERTIEIVTTLLDISQHVLPAPIINPLKKVIDEKRSNKHSQQLILEALKNAKTLGYL